mgnify:CR=1 FL=1
MPEPSLESMVKGQRVGLHPATDLWMRGARFGTVTGTAISNGKDMLMVALDGEYRRQVNGGRAIMLGWEDVIFMASNW